MSQGLAKALTEWIELQDLEAAAAEHAAPAILFPGNLGGSRREAGYMAENWCGTNYGSRGGESGTATTGHA